uniref:Uncharacterized protein n=1 Tax=Tanacetum cinerariifolium TaxID=118510 RepID=A0A699KQB1_TANCI|nr:hypothetical protein [Tanacetum cinerariifolium]
MSDSEDSMVTYTEVSSEFEEPSDVGSLRVMVYGYDRLPMYPPSPDYVPEPKHPPSPDYVSGHEHPSSPDFVLEPVYPEFMPLEDDVLPAEEQPLPATILPTTDSPRYIIESDLEEDLEDDDKDPKDDPADYPTDREEDEEDEDESFRDDADDEEEDEEEEEHPGSANSIPPPPVHHTTARKSFPAQEPVLFMSEEEVKRLLSLPTPPPSPLTPYSSPLPQIPSPPLPTSTTHPLGYRAVMIRLRVESPSTSHPLPLPQTIILPHTRASMAMMRATAPSTYILAPPSGKPPLLPIPLPTSSSPLLLPSTDCTIRSGSVYLLLLLDLLEDLEQFMVVLAL